MTLRITTGRVARPAPGCPFVRSLTGRIYGACGTSVVYSDDNWATTKRLADVGRIISMVYVTSEGTVIAGTVIPGEVYRISPTGVVTKVLTLHSGSYIERWSINGYGTKVVVGEYGQKAAANPADNARRVYLSVDDGQTFTQVFEIPAVAGVHVHAVGIDPHTDQIWVCHGDNIHGVYRLDSPDWTPTQVSDVQQPTSVIALHQDYVLFGSDYSEFPNGVWRYTKATGVFERVLALDAQHDMPFFASGYDPGTQTAYFGSANMNDAIPYVSIYAAQPPFDTWEIVDEVDNGAVGDGYMSIMSVADGRSLLFGFKSGNSVLSGAWNHQKPLLRAQD